MSAVFSFSSSSEACKSRHEFLQNHAVAVAGQRFDVKVMFSSSGGTGLRIPQRQDDALTWDEFRAAEDTSWKAARHRPGRGR